MQRIFLAGILGSLALCTSVFAGDMAIPDRPLEKGTVRFQPLGDQQNIPERYRLDVHTFDFELSTRLELPSADLDVYPLRFPSPVETEVPENNSVHGDYYRPRGDGPFPAVIVLDILNGDGSVSRMVATALAQKHIAALALQMPYYGERRPKGSRVRMISTDFDHTMDAVRQTVLDVRRASAWLASRKEVDAKRLGIVGTSLGSFMGSLSAEMEPRLGRVALLLGGGGIVDAFYDNPRAEPFRKSWEALGGTKASLTRLVAPADPLTYAANLKERKLLMIAGKQDDIVPPKMAEALWKASGQQKIVWYDCTHYGAVKYVVPAMTHLVKHFGAE
jgi:dienelactone hydrolase